MTDRRDRKTIALVSGFPLNRNPRVLKEAATLAACGFDVTVLGGSAGSAQTFETNVSLANRYGFSFKSVDCVHPWRTQDRIYLFHRRARGRLARLVHQLTGVENRFQLGYFVDDLFKAATMIDANYYIVHLESALWVGLKLIQNGRRVGIDIEDWYSEDLPPETRKHRPVKLLAGLEQQLLNKGVHTTCTSQVMSDALAKEYNCRAPAIIYNAFPWSDRQKLDGQFNDRRNRSVPSIHWYSQTLGTDRGLSDLFAALPYLEREVEIHLRGNAVLGFKNWMSERVPGIWYQRIFIHPLVSNDELLSRIAEHDIGFAGELRYCKNKEFTVSNKILHYLLGGLAVVASDTAGQREVAEQAGAAVRIYPSGNPEALAAQLNDLLSSTDSLRAAKAAALAAAENVFCWERQEPVLLENVSAAFSR
jgi:glycosyltransferase involved in cell wall biosynthesis